VKELTIIIFQKNVVGKIFFQINFLMFTFQTLKKILLKCRCCHTCCSNISMWKCIQHLIHQKVSQSLKICVSKFWQISSISAFQYPRGRWNVEKKKKI